MTEFTKGLWKNYWSALMTKTNSICKHVFHFHFCYSISAIPFIETLWRNPTKTLQEYPAKYLAKIPIQ